MCEVLTYEDVLARSEMRSDIMLHLLRLYRLVTEIPLDDKVVVELGLSKGESTTALLAAVNDSGGHLFSVDILECLHARDRLVDEPNWTFIQGDDMEVVKGWDRPIDHLFIDTSHTFEHTLAELREWGVWVKESGSISLHDIYLRRVTGVMEAVRVYLLENPSFVFAEFSGSNGLGVIQKPSLRCLRSIEGSTSRVLISHGC